MAKTEQKSQFQFKTNKAKTTQEQYENSIEDASYTYNKYKQHTTTIHKNFLHQNKREQHLDKLKFEELQELQTWLKHFKDETIQFMETTATILQKQHKQQPKYNRKAATTIKEQINKEQTQIKQQYKQTKKHIHQIFQQHKTIKTEQTTNKITKNKEQTNKTNKIPYFIPREELTQKCQTLKYNYNPKEIDNFINDHEIATKAQYPKHWQIHLVNKLRNKLDTEWKAASTSWPWTQITWQQLQTKIQENIKLRYPPLIQRETWFNINKTNTETITQYISRIHASMNTF